MSWHICLPVYLTPEELAAIAAARAVGQPAGEFVKGRHARGALAGRRALRAAWPRQLSITAASILARMSGVFGV
jgi:hypothetical protein